jgi:hypothetical protein
MKAINISTAAKGISIILLFAFLLTTSLKAQSSPQPDVSKISNDAKASLIKGIESSNLGFKRDCIYFSTIYGIKEALDALKDQLKEEEDPSTCVLISLAIYKLSEPENINVLQGDALQNWNSEVKLITSKIVEQYENSKSDVVIIDK